MEGLAEQAFRRHYADVFRYLRRRTRTSDAAEELTQRVFADAAAALETADPGTPVLAWLYTVAARRFADEARRASRASAARFEERTAEVAHGPSVARSIRAGLEALPPDQREVVVLKLLRGLSFAEISRLADASEAACKMRFVRGLRRLRSTLEAEGIDR